MVLLTIIILKGNKDKILSIKEYLNIIKPYLSDIIDYHKEEWKIQLMMKINFVTTEKLLKSMKYE